MKTDFRTISNVANIYLMTDQPFLSPLSVTPAYDDITLYISTLIRFLKVSITFGWKHSYIDVFNVFAEVNACRLEGSPKTFRLSVSREDSD